MLSTSGRADFRPRAPKRRRHCSTASERRSTPNRLCFHDVAARAKRRSSSPPPRPADAAHASHSRSSHMQGAHEESTIAARRVQDGETLQGWYEKCRTTFPRRDPADQGPRPGAPRSRLSVTRSLTPLHLSGPEPVPRRAAQRRPARTFPPRQFSCRQRCRGLNRGGGCSGPGGHGRSCPQQHRGPACGDDIQQERGMIVREARYAVNVVAGVIRFPAPCGFPGGAMIGLLNRHGRLLRLRPVRG